MQNAFNRIDELIQRIPDEDLQQDITRAFIDLITVLAKDEIEKFLIDNDLLKD